MIEKEQKGMKLNSRGNIALLGKIGTLVVEKGTKTLLLRTIEEQKGLKLNSKRNIIGQIRNIHGWKGNKSSLLGMIEKEQNGLKRNYHF